jgi:O-antigen/teichoic acid export membrane protein
MLTLSETARLVGGNGGHRGKSILSEGAKLAATQVFAGVATFLLAAYVARHLDPASFGRWQIAVAASTYLVILSGLGMPQYGTWLAARAPAAVRRVAAAVMSWRIIAAIAVALVSVATVLLLPISRDHAALLVTVVVAALIRSLWPDWLLQGIRRFNPLVIATIAYPAACLALVVALVHGTDDLLKLPVSQILVGVVLGVAVWVWLLSTNRSRSDASLPNARGIFRESLPLAIAALLIQVVTNVDYILIGILRSEAETAVYAAAAVIALFVHSVGIGFHGAVFPAVTAAAERGEDLRALVGGVAGFAMLFAIPAAIGLSALAPEVTGAIYGTAYVRSAEPLRLLAFYIPVGIYATFFMNLLVARGDRTAYALTFAFGAAINVLLNLALIPALGVMGAALTSLVTVTLIAAVGIRRAGIGIPIDRRILLVSLASSGVMIAVIAVTNSFPLALRIILAAAAYVAVAVGLLIVLARSRGVALLGG